MAIFRLSKAFPKEETYSLTDQIRRASRSVNANLSEAWRKRRYSAAFIAKLSDAETEAAETQTWLEFAVSCGYLDRATGKELNDAYEEIIKMIIAMINHPDKWILTNPCALPSPCLPLSLSPCPRTTSPNPNPEP